MNHYKRWVIYTAAAFLLISATLVNTPNLYFMATLLLALPLISYGLGMLALRDLEFRYVGLDKQVSALAPGGRLSFREVANGITLVDRWALRLVSGRNSSCPRSGRISAR